MNATSRYEPVNVTLEMPEDARTVLLSFRLADTPQAQDWKSGEAEYDSWSAGAQEYDSWLASLGEGTRERA